MTALEEIKKALEGAEQFIVNGVELGYIRIPAPETPDSAHDTLPMIRQAQAALESLQRENEDAKRIDPALIGICEEMEESGGHWQPCTGCYDTLEGHPTQKYDYSPALQSPVGCGCHECGGLGAVWWYMSEQDIADFEKISEELDAEQDLTMRISRLEYLLRSLCKAYAACNGEDHPAYVEARTALASTGGERHAE